MLGGSVEFLADAELRKQGLDPVENPEEYEAAWPAMLERIKAQVAARARRGQRRSAASTSSAPSATSRAASTTSCVVVPAARATRASPGSTCRSQDELMRLFKSDWVDRVLQVLQDPRRRPDREQAGHRRDRQRPGPGRVAELRVPQERPQVRRRDGPPAQGDLRRAPRGARGRRPRGADPRLHRRRRRRLRHAAPPRASPRSGTSTACGPRSARSTRSSRRPPTSSRRRPAAAPT